MAAVLFYDKPVAINRDKHRTATIGATGSFAFAARTNSVALTGVEFGEAAKEYPIVFAAVGDRRLPVALLGLRDRENLFVDASGRWDARYVPAFVRRYPFVLADKGDGEFVVCVDEAAPEFGAAGGQAMFDDAGANTPFLDNALAFLNAYQAEFARTEAFVARLQDLGLLREMSARTDLNDGRSFVLGQLFIVDEQKLLQLDDGAAAALLKSGDAAWVHAHLLSLSNMGRLVDRVGTGGTSASNAAEGARQSTPATA